MADNSSGRKDAILIRLGRLENDIERLSTLEQTPEITSTIAASYEEPLVKLRFERRVAVLRDAPGAGRHTGRGQSPERRFGRDQMRLKALRSSSSTRLA